MAFDPTLPVNGSAVSSAELRAQFNALKALHDAQATTIATQGAQIAALITEMSQRMRASDALAVFAANINGITGDATSFDDPPSAAQIAALRDKLNELITGLQAN